MNTKHYRELLDDVFAGGSAIGSPSASHVVALIRREKATRRRRRFLATGVAATMLILAALPLVYHTGTSPEPAVGAIGSITPAGIAPETGPQGFEVVRIGDEELLDLLGEQPSALVQFPDGERELMLVVWQPFSEGALDADAVWSQSYNR